MHVGDRVRNRSNGARGRVKEIPSTTPGSIVVLQNDATVAPWTIGDAEIVRPIVQVIAEQEEVLEASMRAVQRSKTDENLLRLESASAQLRDFLLEARGVFTDE
jgi:hypothetical protein